MNLNLAKAADGRLVPGGGGQQGGQSGYSNPVYQASLELKHSGEDTNPDPVLFVPDPTPNFLFNGKIAYISSKFISILEISQ